MKLLALLLLGLFVGFFTSACSQKTQEGNLNEIKSLIERAESCIHFSGEFNGDRSERDREVIAEMNQLKCADIDQELLSAKEIYKNNPEILELINQASVQY